MTGQAKSRFVSRGGEKLAHALREFELTIAGLRCADLGCSTGGFTDCLLQSGATSVVAVDTGYGVLDYRLRVDPGVHVFERRNALHFHPPEELFPVDLVTIDLGWTRQRMAIPCALRWVVGAANPRIITLIKPHYERPDDTGATRNRGVLDDAQADQIARQTLHEMPESGAEVIAAVRSPLRGGTKNRGNIEWLALLRPLSPE